jgi:hypothetical protein
MLDSLWRAPSGQRTDSVNGQVAGVIVVPVPSARGNAPSRLNRLARSLPEGCIYAEDRLDRSAHLASIHACKAHKPSIGTATSAFVGSALLHVVSLPGVDAIRLAIWGVALDQLEGTGVSQRALSPSGKDGRWDSLIGFLSPSQAEVTAISSRWMPPRLQRRRSSAVRRVLRDRAVERLTGELKGIGQDAASTSTQRAGTTVRAAIAMSSDGASHALSGAGAASR